MSKAVNYIAFFFLTISLIYSIKGAVPIGDFLFFPMMAFSLFLSVFSIKVTKEIIINRGFKLFFYVNILNLFYYVLFEFGDFESFKYLISRFVQFSIFSISIFFLKDNFSFYLIRFIKVFTVLSLISSLVFNFPDFNTRYMGIFFNPNEFSIIMVLGFSVFLFDKKKSAVEYFLILAFLIFIVISGSRSAFVGLLLSIFMYTRVNQIKLFTVLFFLLSVSFYFIFGYHESNVIFRISENSLFYNRQLEYMYAIDTLMQKPFFGYGLKNYAFIDANVIDFENPIDFGAHNGYLSLLVQYGLIFGIIFFSIMIGGLVKIFRYDYTSSIENNMHVVFLKFVLIYTLINGLTENTFVGINYLQSNLFWIILAFLLFKIYDNENSSISDRARLLHH